MKNDSVQVRQPIYVDGPASQCVITIEFNPVLDGHTSEPSFEGIPDGKPFLKISDVADRLSLSRTNLYKYLMNGELESIKVGRSRLIPVGALEKFIDRLSRDTR